MSYIHSRPEKSESNQYRKNERRSSSSNQQRSSSSAYVKGGGPSPSYNSSSSSNRGSFKKNSYNAQGGGQSRVGVPAANSSLSESSNASTPRTTTVQNGSHVQPQLHGASDAPVAVAAAKPTELSAPQRTSRAVPKAPTSQSAPMSSDSMAPTTPAKAQGDASKPFPPFQFGSISPGFVNGMQIPARTSSAPPNLDEQKKDQARHDYRSVPPLPTPVPKQPLPRKDAGAVDQSNTGEAHPMPKAKKDAQVSPAPHASQSQKPSVHPKPVPMIFHQPQVSVPFGGPNPQIQSQGMAANSLQMQLPMPLAMGNAPQVQQPVFVQGLQPHPMQPQGLMHQGQGLSFATQMSPQLPPQLGNMGIGMTPPYPQQQGGKYGGPRKTTVKISYPDTHEEVRLDKLADSHSDGGSSAPRSHPNVPSQSQPIPSFAPSHPPINYYLHNSYNGSSVFYAPSSSVPLTSSQMTPNSQAPRFNYPVSQGPQNVGFMNQSALNTLPVNKTGNSMHGVADPPNLEHSRDVHNLISSAPSTAILVTVKPTAGSSSGEKIADLSQSSSLPGVEKGESPKPPRPSRESSSSHPQRDTVICSESTLQQSKPGVELATKQSVAVFDAVSSEVLTSNPLSSASAPPSQESVPAVINNEGRRRETLSRSNSIKEYQKKPGKKGHIQSQHQVSSQSTLVSSLSSQALEHSVSSNSGVSGIVEAKTTLVTPATSEVVSLTLESLPTVGVATPDVSELKVGSVGEGSTSVSSEISGTGTIVDNMETDHHAKLDESSSQDEQLVHETVGADVQGETRLPEEPKQDTDSCEIFAEPISKSLELVNLTAEKQSGQDAVLKATTISKEAPTLETAKRGLEEPVSHAEINRTTDNLDVSTSTILGSKDVEGSHGEKASTLDASYASSCKSDCVGSNEVVVTMSGIPDQQSAPVQTLVLMEGTSKREEEGAKNVGGGLVSFPTSVSKDKPVPELSKARGKKKKKEFLLKADAAGTTSDLYNAYKGPEEKKETVLSSESAESTSTSVNLKQAPADAVQVDSITSEKGGPNKAEPDDWEDAADISTPKVEVSDNGQQAHGGLDYHDKDGDIMAKKYSRDFLLKFAVQCTDLPKGFEIPSDLGDPLMSPIGNISHPPERDSYPSSGRITDRTSGGSRTDRRGSGMVEEDKWSKPSGHFGSGRDVRLDPGYGVNASFRLGPGGNFGVLRNPRGQAPMQYPGGILSGPSVGSQGVMSRNNSDADRWVRATNNQQKGLIPSPHTPLLMMHKADRKYEVGKVTDEEQSKQRQLKAILNKLTPQNFDKLFEQVKEVNIDNEVTLVGVISQIFDKALTEPTFCEMYANFCHNLAGALPDLSKDNEKITFRRLLLNKCQEEFERGEREQEEADKVSEEGEVKQSEEEREEKRIKSRRRMLGNIRLIGELYKKRMLTEKIMHTCIKKLLGDYNNPDEENIEALCKLMSTIGQMIDHPIAKDHIDSYYEHIEGLSNNMNLSSRIRFMLKDAIDLRKNKWQQRRKVEGPKKIEEVHRDAAQERQAQVSRSGRGPGINLSARRAPMDFGQRGSTVLSSPNAQLGSFRGLPTQVRGYGNQDVRFEERQSFEARTLSAVPLPQRPIGDESITLGPQGGLARVMSMRGPPAMSSAPVAEFSPSLADPRRLAAGLNGYSNVSERTTYSAREDLASRYMSDRLPGPAAYDQSSPHERNMNYGNRDLRTDRNFDRSLATSPPARGQGSTLSQSVPSEKVVPEERLRDKSMATIKEFYSIRDEKEVALCVKELNSPIFLPSMVSLWVSDSFERKDVERDLLAKLLVNLTKSWAGVLSQTQLIKGFESVLTSLEDAVNDAPRAAEFLGRIFAEVVTEGVIPLREIGRLISEGGEEAGCLREIGLAADVLGSTLEIIKSEKGDAVLNDICTSSNLRLEDFRPPDLNRSRKLDKFIRG